MPFENKPVPREKYDAMHLRAQHAESIALKAMKYGLGYARHQENQLKGWAHYYEKLDERNDKLWASAQSRDYYQKQFEVADAALGSVMKQRQFDVARHTSRLNQRFFLLGLSLGTAWATIVALLLRRLG